MACRQSRKGRRKPQADDASSASSGSAKSDRSKLGDGTKTPRPSPPANLASGPAQLPAMPPAVLPVPSLGQPSLPPSPPSAAPLPASRPPIVMEPVRKENGEVQVTPASSAVSSAPTTLLKLPLPSASDAAAAPIGGLTLLPALAQPSGGPAVSGLPLPGRVAAADPEPVDEPPNHTWNAVGIVIGSIAGTIALGLLLALVFVRRRRRRPMHQQSLPYSTASGPRADATATTTATTTPPAPWEFMVRQQPVGPSDAAASLKPPAPLFPRYSNRSTGLTLLDEKQWRAYRNLTGQSNPKQAVPFNHPFYRHSEWR